MPACSLRLCCGSSKILSGYTAARQHTNRCLACLKECSLKEICQPEALAETVGRIVQYGRIA